MRCHLRALLLLQALAGSHSWRWELPSVKGSLQRRTGHTATPYFTERVGTKIIVCGGEAEPGGAALGGCDVLDPFDSWAVSQGVAAADGAARTDHVAALLSGYLVLWGGKASGNVSSGLDCEIFQAGSWSMPEPRGACANLPDMIFRYGHSGVVYNSQLFVYGGAMLPEEGQAPQDVDDAAQAVLRLRYQPGSSPPLFQWDAPELASTASTPPPRHYHAAAVLTSANPASFPSIMFVHGGFSFALGTALNDVWQLTLEGGPLLWTQRAAVTSLVPARYGHRLVLTGSTLICYGGQNGTATDVLTVTVGLSGNAGDWSSPVVGGEPLRSPFRSAAVLIDADGNASPEMVVIGGASSAQASAAVSSAVASLNEIGESFPSLEKELPVILGSAAAAVFFLLVLGFFAWRRKVVLYDEDESPEEQLLRAGGGGGGGGGAAGSSFLGEEAEEGGLAGQEDLLAEEEAGSRAGAGRRMGYGSFATPGAAAKRSAFSSSAALSSARAAMLFGLGSSSSSGEAAELQAEEEEEGWDGVGGGEREGRGAGAQAQQLQGGEEALQGFQLEGSSQQQAPGSSRSARKRGASMAERELEAANALLPDLDSAEEDTMRF
jgi:hypothetical protein